MKRYERRRQEKLTVDVKGKEKEEREKGKEDKERKGQDKINQKEI